MTKTADEFFALTPAKRDLFSGGTTKSAEPVRLPEGSLLPDDPQIRQTLTDAAEKYKINPALLFAMAHQESTYNPNAVGPTTKWGTAKGMFQFLDSTAKGHGIDAFNYTQAADSAAKDLAAQILKDGPEWAVAHHHGGPNKKLHGPKTQRYAQEVLAKAEAIAKELGVEFTGDPRKAEAAATEPTATKSADEFFGDTAAPAAAPKKAPVEEESLGDTFRKRVAQDMAETGIPVPGLAQGVAGVKRSIARGWEGVQNILNRETEEITYTDDELRRKYETEVPAMNKFGRNAISFQDYARQNRTRTVSKDTVREEEAAWRKRLAEKPEDAYLLPKRLSHLRQPADDSKFAPANTFKGFAQRIVAGHKTPMDLLLQDSIPANIVTHLANLPEAERQKFDRARAVTKAMEIQKDADASEEAQAWSNETLKQWNDETDSSVKKAWNALYDAARENPAQVGLAFSEALFADPYMVMAPVGIGLKPVRAAQAVQGIRASTVAGRAAKVADAIIDGSVTAGTLNVAAGAAENLATTGTVNEAEVKLNAAMGVILGGGLAPLFMKGARAKSRLHDTDKLRADGALDEAMQDAAKADVEMESQISGLYDADYGIGAKETPIQKRLRELFGIQSKEDAKKVIDQRRKDIKETFKNESDYADYLNFVAQEKLDRAAALAAEAEAKAAAQQAAADAVTTRAAVYREQWQSEFDAAIEAREALKDSQSDIAWQKHEEAAAIADRLNAEELAESLYTGDSATIKQTEAKIARREAGLNRSKWQRGETDPETLARLGVVAGGAAAGFALADEDSKLGGTLLGGLAGLTVPAGGSVLSRMRQSGAIASDGQIISALVKSGKLANKLEEADIIARDNAWIDLARTGDQQGFKYLYDSYIKEVERFVYKFVANRESRLALTEEDLASEAMTKAFMKLQEDPDFVLEKPFVAFVKEIASNRAKDVLDAHGATKRGSGAAHVSEDVAGTRDSYSGDPATSAYSLMDNYAGRMAEGDAVPSDIGTSELSNTPEAALVRDQTLDIIRQSLDGMPQQAQDVFTKVHLQHYTLEEAAKELGISTSGAWHQLRRVENVVRDNIAKDKLKFGEPAKPAEGVRGPRNQRGEASTEHMGKVAAVTAAATAAGTAGYFLYDGDPWKTFVSAGFGAAGAAGLAGGGGKVLSKALRGVDYRIREFGPSLYGLAKKHGFSELTGIREYNNATADFINMFHALKDDLKPTLIEALSTRDRAVIDKMLNHLGGRAFVEAFDKVRVKLDEVEDLLVGYGLISKSEKDYFPFRVKDLEGLKKELGKDFATDIEAALAKAEATMKEKAGRELNDIERGIITNKVLEPYLGKPLGPQRPGFSKARTIQRIPERLQKYYHDPVETLNSYGVQAIKYIERAKFFGKHLVKKKENGKEFVDVSRSIGELVDDLRKKDQLTDQQVFELKNILQDRFNGGEKGTNRFLAGMKNLVNASLLGHMASAVVQLGDIALQGLVHGPRASVKALRRQFTRNKLRKLDDFGLNEHVAHEFLSDGWTRKVSDWSFKWGGFRAIDATGKNFGLNAAIERMMKDARTPEGQMRLADQYQRYFPDDYPKALAALKKGEINEAVELLAFTDLTKTQPLTQWELPQFYQKFPNGRVLYHLQTFSIRVMNLVYEEALKDIVSGNLKQATRGTKRLFAIGAVLGVQGVATDKIKDVLAGKEVELSFEEIPINALEAMGLSLYDYNRIADKGPLAGFAESKMPPVLRMSNDLLNEPERSLRYVPVGGRAAYDFFREPLEERRKERRKAQGYKMEINVPAREADSSRSDRTRTRRPERKRRERS